MLTLKINTKNLIENAKYLRGETSAEVCAVVKANAYGHGFKIAEYLDSRVSCFAVACGDEALQLRKFTNKPIYVLGPSEDLNDDNIIYCAASKNDLHHKRVCVKINTGMNRLGVLPQDFPDFLDQCYKNNVEVDSVFTHFSDINYAPFQLERFMSVKTDLKRHACATNFLCLDKKYHLDMVRVGLGLYGYGNKFLKPVLSAYTDVYNVIEVKKGDRIGYSFSAPRDMKVAVLGAGYADGIRRIEQKFFINDRVCPSVGHVCMDMCFVDVSGSSVKPGDRAEFLGSHLHGEDVAENNGTIIYEVLTSFGSRARRIYE